MRVDERRIGAATRRALTLFDQWNTVTGFVTPFTSYYYELQGIIEDAVQCGAQVAAGVHEPLESELEQAMTRWTTERPTRAGWYWWRDAHTSWVFKIELHPDLDVLCYREAHDLYPIGDILGGEWQGPIEPEA